MHALRHFRICPHFLSKRYAEVSWLVDSWRAAAGKLVCRIHQLTRHCLPATHDDIATGWMLVSPDAPSGGGVINV